MYNLKFIFATLLTLFFFNGFSQTYHLSKTQGRLVIEGVNEVVVEGYTGNEIIFERLDYDHDHNKKAAGLMALSANGLKDNTKIGLSVIDNGQEVNVQQIGKNSDIRFKIKIPHTINVYYSHSSHNGEDIHFKNVESEIEVSVNYNDVHLENVTGPMAISAVYGDVNAHFKSVSQSNAIAIQSVYGDVDVTLPVNTRANLVLNTSYGEMFTDFDIKTSNNSSSKSTDGCNGCGSKNRFMGTINGGGVDISLKANYDNIYLRKQK